MPGRVRVRDARQWALSILPVVEDIRDHGACTLQEIADALNARGVTALRGGIWTSMQVWRLLRQTAGSCPGGWCSSAGAVTPRRAPSTAL